MPELGTRISGILQLRGSKSSNSAITVVNIQILAKFGVANCGPRTANRTADERPHGPGNLRTGALRFEHLGSATAQFEELEFCYHRCEELGLCASNSAITVVKNWGSAPRTSGISDGAGLKSSNSAITELGLCASNIWDQRRRGLKSSNSAITGVKNSGSAPRILLSQVVKNWGSAPRKLGSAAAHFEDVEFSTVVKNWGSPPRTYLVVQPSGTLKEVGTGQRFSIWK
ncbi:hypothetical protein DFP72DRAFT_845053 [Ephemerocybe angulata]|uniref:Uncharacterized protein n=1 Tax=Ephemerocybe angulata TaxID=980116 RepID=A0A8H6MC50_9AGAR|nr:hypothetical protein DFP72DRAFT_845053 [Tulosesus angulatus]